MLAYIGTDVGVFPPLTTWVTHVSRGGTDVGTDVPTPWPTSVTMLVEIGAHLEGPPAHR